MLAQSSRAATISPRTAEARTAATTAALSSPSRPSPASANADTYSGSAAAGSNIPSVSTSFAAWVRASSRRCARFRSALAWSTCRRRSSGPARSTRCRTCSSSCRASWKWNPLRRLTAWATVVTTSLRSSARCCTSHTPPPLASPTRASAVTTSAAAVGLRRHQRQERSTQPTGRAWIGRPSPNRLRSSASAAALA